MKVTVEMSLYPLTKDYEGPILRFIQHLKGQEALTVKTTSMSTYVKGEGKAVLSHIAEAIEILDEQGFTASLVMKIINRDLPVEEGFLEF